WGAWTSTWSSAAAPIRPPPNAWPPRWSRSAWLPAPAYCRGCCRCTAGRARWKGPTRSCCWPRRRRTGCRPWSSACRPCTPTNSPRWWRSKPPPACPATSAGWSTPPATDETGKPRMTPIPSPPARRLPGLLLMLLAWLAPALAAHAAVSEDELLPVDQAFVLSASAPEPGRIEVQWKIAEGYYLYRHRTSVTASGDFVGGNLRLPAGERHVDEFFGPVETYRGQLLATLDGQPTGAGAIAELEVRYQGCADAGICYPPQTRQVQVRLPAAGQAGTRQSGSPGRGRLAAALAGVGGALPESQAFAVDAVADGGNRLRVRLQPVEGYY